MIVLDVNILISSFISGGGAPAAIRALWEEERLEAAISQPIVEELERVIRYPHLQDRYQYSEEEAQEFVDLVKSSTTWVNPTATIKAVERDPDDDKYLECALSSGAKIVVSGDKHLLQLKRYQDIEVLSPREFLTYLKIE